MRTDVEFLRLLSALGIVWFHSGLEMGKDIAYSGLVVFLILTSYFSIKSNSDHSILSRAHRFLIPCILWSILFGSLELVRGKAMFPESYSLVSKLLSTPSVHLWYLPFAFLCVILIDKIKYLDSKTISISAAILLGILLLTSVYWREWPYFPPFSQYIHALPAVLFGIIFGVFYKLPNSLKYPILAFISLTLAITFYYSLPGISQTYVLGVLASLILLRSKSILPENKLINDLSKLTFGVYLIHPLVLFGVKKIGITSFFLPILAFLISMLAIYLMAKVIPKQIRKYII